MQPAEKNLVIWPLGFNNPNKFLFAAQNPNIKKKKKKHI